MSESRASIEPDTGRRILEALDRMERKLQDARDELSELTGKVSAGQQLLGENKSELRDIRQRLFVDPDGIQGRLRDATTQLRQHVEDDARMQRFLIAGFAVLFALQLQEQLKWVERLLAAVAMLARV